MPFVDRYVAIRNGRTPPPLVRRESAGVFVVLILGWGAPLDVPIPRSARTQRLPGGLVRGGRRTTATARPRLWVPGPGVELLLAPPAARRLLGVPLGELANRAVVGRAAHRCLARPAAWSGSPRRPAGRSRFALLDVALAAPAGGLPVGRTPRLRSGLAAGSLQSAGRIGIGLVGR